MKNISVVVIRKYCVVHHRYCYFVENHNTCFKGLWHKQLKAFELKANNVLLLYSVPCPCRFDTKHDLVR